MSAIDAQLASTAHSLNLKTFKEEEELAAVIKRLRVGSGTDSSRERERDEIYKKFWHLKSIGQYHGSLLAKPRIHAPEIRE